MATPSVLSKEFIESGSEKVPFSGCWIWSKPPHKVRYGQVTFRGRPEKAHRLSWMAFRGDVGSLHVLHKCDVPFCVNPDHLFLGTHQDNMDDREAKGRNKMPPQFSPSRKLSDDAAKEILAAKTTRSPGDRTPFILAEKFGVKVRAIYKIWEGVTWRHLWAS